MFSYFCEGYDLCSHYCTVSIDEVAHLLHALLEEGVPPGLADNNIGPLDHHDAGEEGRVAGEFNDLPLLVRLQGLKHTLYLLLL